MGSGLDWLGKMLRKCIHGCIGASLDGSNGVYIIRGHRTGFGKKERALGRDYLEVFLCVEMKWRLLPSSLRGFIWESAVFGAGERLTVHGNGEQRAIQASCEKTRRIKRRFKNLKTKYTCTECDNNSLVVTLEDILHQLERHLRQEVVK